MNLRQYQTDAIDKLTASFQNGHRKVILQASTGAGKTVVAADLIRRIIINGKHVLFVAHRKEIINQTSDKLDAFNIQHGVIMSSHKRINAHAVQVASIQTISRRNKPPADVIIFDEGHLSISKSYVDLVKAYPDAVVLCLTATPIRGDGRGMGEIYTDIVQVVPMAQLRVSLNKRHKSFIGF